MSASHTDEEVGGQAGPTTEMPEATQVLSLTYLSTATSPRGPAELTSMLSSARDRNEHGGVTGMLLYADGHFIQTLEGPDDAVHATFARIVRDTRHRNVYVALREAIAARLFPDWSMGFESLSMDEASVLPGFTDYLDGRTLSTEGAQELGRAGIFHRVFRNKKL